MPLETLPKINLEPYKAMESRWNERIRRHVLSSAQYLATILLFTAVIGLKTDTIIAENNSITPEYSFLVGTRILTLISAVVILAISYRFRDRLSLRTLKLFFIFMMSPMLITFALAYYRYGHLQAFMTPPPGVKLALIVLACLEMGSIWVNAAWMFAVGVEGILCWYFFVASARIPDARAEAITLFIFMVTSTGILFFRKNHQGAVRELFRAEARAGSAEYVAKAFLNLRDRANTPLQSLEIGLNLLKADPSDREVKRNLQNALENLKGLFSQFAIHQSSVDWNDEELLHFERPEGDPDEK